MSVGKCTRAILTLSPVSVRPVTTRRAGKNETRHPKGRPYIRRGCVLVLKPRLAVSLNSFWFLTTPFPESEDIHRGWFQWNDLASHLRPNSLVVREGQS